VNFVKSSWALSSAFTRSKMVVAAPVDSCWCTMAMARLRNARLSSPLNRAEHQGRNPLTLLQLTPISLHHFSYTNASHQGLTLVHFSAHLERFSCNRGCA